MPEEAKIKDGEQTTSDVYYEDELHSISEEVSGEVTEEIEEKPKTVAIRKPFLKMTHLKKGNPENEFIVLEWLDFLISKNDIGELIKILSYYVDLGWISEDVKNHLISYARGFMETTETSSFSEVQLDSKKYRLMGSKNKKKEKSLEAPSTNLKTRDHIRSLLYILEILKDEIPEKAYEKILKRAGIEKDEIEKSDEVEEDSQENS